VRKASGGTVKQAVRMVEGGNGGKTVRRKNSEEEQQ
jgi:hypothetical protein